MKRETISYTIRELVEGFTYNKSEEKGLHGLNGSLVIQPEYQRNYIYADGKKDVAVITSVLEGVSLGELSFRRREDGTLEIIDGQQRVTSIGRFCLDLFAVPIGESEFIFDNLEDEMREEFLSARINATVYAGTALEIKNVFRKVNAGGVLVNEQEISNAIYSGPFVSAGRKVFSNKKNTDVIMYAEKLMQGSAERQDYWAQALAWVSGGEVEKYMSKHQKNATEVEAVSDFFFTTAQWAVMRFGISPAMRGVGWGRLYREHSSNGYEGVDTKALAADLLDDPAVRNKKGVFEYVLTGCANPSLLDVRVFDAVTKQQAYKRQTDAARDAGTSNCLLCAVGHDAAKTREYRLTEMEADHVAAWSRGGLTTLENCQMLCTTHNRAKGNR